jgi:REP element-mobilizing transposase RayT
MPTGPRILMENACYHIITRGNQRQQIFWDEKEFADTSLIGTETVCRFVQIVDCFWQILW